MVTNEEQKNRRTEEQKNRRTEEQKNAPHGSINVAHQTIFEGDNLDILRGMNSACVDLIYLDPPFNSKHNYAAPIGSHAAGAAFKDTWGLNDIKLVWHGEIKQDYPALYAFLNAVKVVHGDSMMSYLMYMAIRLIELKRVLKPTGSLYLHCDPTASHYLKLLMDAVFGRNAFKSEVIWQRDGAIRGAKSHSKKWPNVCDTLLFYTNGGCWSFDLARRPITEEQVKRYRYTDSDGRRYRTSHLGDYTEESVKKLRASGLVHVSSSGKESKKYYLDEASYVIGSCWTDIKGFGIRSASNEKTGYPTQKPLALLERIIKASSQEDDVVLDPFCGCATTCIASEKLGRRWIGIDLSPKAAELIQIRMQREVGLFFQGAIRTDIPQRTDLGKLIPYNALNNKKYLYGEQGGYCHGCEHHFPMQNLTVDHIVAQAHGGTDHISNLQLLCGNCNSMKGTKTQEELLLALTDKGYVKRKHAA